MSVSIVSEKQRELANGPGLFYLLGGLYLSNVARNFASTSYSFPDSLNLALYNALILFGIIWAVAKLKNRMFIQADPIFEQPSILVVRLWVHTLITYIIVDHLIIPLFAGQSLWSFSQSTGLFPFSKSLIPFGLALIYASVATFGAVQFAENLPKLKSARSRYQDTAILTIIVAILFYLTALGCELNSFC